MKDQMEAIVQEKILLALEAPLPKLTPRDARVPSISGKAMAVIGMRRAGKTSFRLRPLSESARLFQLRG
jgi:predicted AAA+ superfamily ATPase